MANDVVGYARPEHKSSRPRFYGFFYIFGECSSRNARHQVASQRERESPGNDSRSISKSERPAVLARWSLGARTDKCQFRSHGEIPSDVASMKKLNLVRGHDDDTMMACWKEKKGNAKGRETKRHLAKVDDDTVSAVNSSFCHIIHVFLASFFFLNLIFCLQFANKSHLLKPRRARASERRTKLRRGNRRKLVQRRGLFIKGSKAPELLGI
jgi:hypothetical protein